MQKKKIMNENYSVSGIIETNNFIVAIKRKDINQRRKKKLQRKHF